MGVNLGKDSWTGMKGHLIKNVPDIACGTFFLDTEICDVFECTVPYFENYLVWHPPRAIEVAKWRSLFLVFELPTWLAFVAVRVAVVLLWRMARSSRAEPSDTHPLPITCLCLYFRTRITVLVVLKKI